MDNGFDEIIVKTKNRFYEMRSTLAQLAFDVIRFVPHPVDMRRVQGVPQQAARPARHRQPSQPPIRPARRRLICHLSRQDDPRLQNYRHVGDPAWLEQHGLFVAEGAGLVSCERSGSLCRVRDRAGGFVVDSVLVTPAALRALEPELDPAWLVLVADPSIVEGVTGFKFHRGCLALVRRPDTLLPLSAFAHARRLILLEAVGNPDNIGGIFRSATALGADARPARSRVRRPVLPQGRPHVDGRRAAAALHSRRSVAARPRDAPRHGLHDCRAVARQGS